MSLNHFYFYLGLNGLLGTLAVLCVGLGGGVVLFYLLCLLISHCFLTSLLPHRTFGWKKCLHIVLEEYVPFMIVLLVLCLLSKDSLALKSIFLSVCIVVLFSLMLKGFFSLVHSYVSLKVTQFILGLTALILIGGIFLAPPLMVLMNNYETKNQIYLFFAQLNPIIVISNLFGLDPFHKDQLYQFFGSNFLVPKLEGVNTIVLLTIFSLLFWLAYVFWGKNKTANN